MILREILRNLALTGPIPMTTDGAIASTPDFIRQNAIGLVEIGSNYGTNLAGSGDYSCNGRCGAGCTGTAVGNVYTQDCFSHDVCSYFNSASGGASDPNCGAAYNAAVDDTALGALNGCGQTNPSNAVSKPSTQPVCS
ncbi:hypothetical protein Landi51_01413 [Colletotrichum acutatum]